MSELLAVMDIRNGLMRELDEGYYSWSAWQGLYLLAQQYKFENIADQVGRYIEHYSMSSTKVH